MDIEDGKTVVRHKLEKKQKERKKKKEKNVKIVGAMIIIRCSILLLRKESAKGES